MPSVDDRDERNRNTYRRIIAAVEAGDEAALDDLLDPSLVDHNPIPGQSPGRAGFKEWMRSARRSFPDLSAAVEDVVADGERVAGRVRYQGTHRGFFAGIPATGRTVEFEAFHIARFESDVVVEWWGTADLFGALHQIGAHVVGQAD